VPSIEFVHAWRLRVIRWLRFVAFLLIAVGVLDYFRIVVKYVWRWYEWRFSPGIVRLPDSHPFHWYDFIGVYSLPLCLFVLAGFVVVLQRRLMRWLVPVVA